MDRPITPWQVDDVTVDRLPALLHDLEAALAGTGPALAPAAGTPDARPAPLPRTVPAEVALVVRTSGSTGAPRRVLLGGPAMRASAERTHARLGGTGRWVLALPLDHVAGLQVLVRSVVGGTAPVPAGSAPEQIAAAVAGATAHAPGAGRLYTAVVPTQLHRIVDAARGGVLPADLAPLLALDAILVGGAGTAPGLLTAARDLGLRVVTTYGMTETSGGCVYDGVPLDDVRLALDDGVIRIAGPVLAAGYLGDGEAGEPEVGETGFGQEADGHRWFRTADLGRIDEGLLHVLGRRDDMIVTGGVNVAPASVEAVLAGVVGVGQVCVIGVPDREWGSRVTAVVVADAPGAPDLAGLRAAVTRILGPASAPRGLVVVDSLPLRGPGKVDRAAVARLARDAWTTPGPDLR